MDSSLMRTQIDRVPLSLKAVVVLLRPKHWIKNGFVVAPLFLTPSVLSWGSIFRVGAGMLAFCAASSAVYIMNDYRDQTADREHPIKRTRPIASGQVGPSQAFMLVGGLLVTAVVVSIFLPSAFLYVLATYFGINIGYSFGLKDVAIVDVMCIAVGFVLRVQGGVVLIGVQATVWITIMTGLLALFLALAKRRDDLVKEVGTAHRSSISGYTESFLDATITVVLGALLVSYLIYTADARVIARIANANLVYTAPFVIAGIMRYLQLMFVEERTGDPVQIALTDRFMVCTIVGWISCMGVLIWL